jgi:hypothetical protein
MMDWSLESHYTPHLAPGAAQVDAIVSVSLTGNGVGGAESQERVLGFIADRSGSMNGLGRIAAVGNALSAAIDALSADTTFFIVAFDFEATVVFAPATATPTNKQLAQQRVALLSASGGTAMSTGLEMALGFFRGFPKAINRAVFLTDGKNESEKIEVVRRVLADCSGVFECDCWGLGTDWQVGEVQEIARALDGHASLLPDRDAVAAAFREFVATAQGKALRDVYVRLWTPLGAQLSQVRQMNPTIEELGDRARTVSPLVHDFPTGSWAPGETRDYFVSVRVAPGALGDELLACRPSVVFTDAAGQKQEIKAPQARVIATWTADDALQQARAAVAADMARAATLMEQLATANAAARVARIRSLAEIAQPIGLQPELDDGQIEGLRPWLATLQDAMNKGNWSAARVGLNRWLAAASAYKISVERARTANRACLETRDELAGVLRARGAQAADLARRGLYLAPEAEAAARRAKTLLKEVPCRLAEAEVSIQAFDAAVSALAQQARQPHPDR